MAQAVALLLLALGCADPQPERAPSATQRAEGFTLTRSRAGATEWRLESPRADFLETLARARLVSPRIDLYKRGRVETKARSERGEIDLGTQDTLLSGSVRVDNAVDHISLRTDELRFVAKAKQFQTERPVEIRRPEGVMRGRGLTANQDLSEIHVHHQETRLQ